MCNLLYRNCACYEDCAMFHIANSIKSNLLKKSIFSISLSILNPLMFHIQIFKLHNIVWATWHGSYTLTTESGTCIGVPSIHNFPL